MIEHKMKAYLDSLLIDPAKADLARLCHEDLFTGWENGIDPFAEGIIRAAAFDGLLPIATKVIKEHTSEVRLRDSGRIITLAARRGVRKVDENGAPLRTYQQSIFWELPWNRFIEHVKAMVSQYDRLGIKVAALLEVVELKRLYPDTITPLEACEIAGIDPEHFFLGRAA